MKFSQNPFKYWFTLSLWFRLLSTFLRAKHNVVKEGSLKWELVDHFLQRISIQLKNVLEMSPASSASAGGWCHCGISTELYVLINNVVLVVATGEFFFSWEEPAKLLIHFQPLFKEQQQGDRKSLGMVQCQWGPPMKICECWGLYLDLVTLLFEYIVSK